VTDHPHHFFRATDKVVREELDKLVDEGSGRLDPETVVRAAKARTHPLHRYFEWDNSRAAHSFRVSQARALIREVRVIVKTEVTAVTSVAYVRDPSASSRERGYVALHAVKPESERALEVVRQEMVRVEGALARARGVAAAVGLADELDVMVRAAALINGRLAGESGKGKR